MICGVYEIQRTLPDGQVEKGALKKLTLPRNADEIEELRSGQYDEASITAHFSNQLKNLVGEYGMMKKLSGCPNIVHSLDLSYIQHDDGIGWDIFIKMELLTPLKKYLGREIMPEQTIKLGVDLCKALSLCLVTADDVGPAFELQHELVLIEKPLHLLTVAVDE